ncbi:MAG: hypothetical protein DRP85_04570 [Candidatus Makaraimicrobium thalassicum]|nr:MAG: hypothetical protein DRP85_04570 [Candidatus Omnitrophota bacterium]
MERRTDTRIRIKRGLPWKLIPIVLVVLVAAAVIGIRVFKQQSAVMEFQKGVGYVTWSEDGYSSADSDESLGRVRELGTEWICILVTWYQTTPWSGDIQRTAKTPSDEAVTRAVRRAHELGMKVMFKLQLDLLDKSDGSWRGEIASTEEAEWDEWFRGYKDYMMHYVDIANKEKVAMICLGTELSASATVKGYLWRDLIKKVRSRYPGLLTYAAHWDRYQDIRFWDLLDYVGINPYFPLTEKMVPTYDELKQGWSEWVPGIEDFQRRVRKPIIFPEVGCSSAEGAAIRPWEHVPRTEVNLKLQADYYRAILDTFWDKEWFYGLYWWYWGTNVNMGGKFNRGFTPQNKPAEQVIKKWYARPVRK